MTSMAITDTNSDTPCTTTYIDLQFHPTFKPFDIFTLLSTFPVLNLPIYLFRVVPPLQLIVTFHSPLFVVYLVSCSVYNI